MRTPEVVSIEVVLDNNEKKFRLPDGSLVRDITAGKYGSWEPHKGREGVVGSEREIDTPFMVFRNGACYDRGICEFIFGSDGYHVVTGMTRIKTGRDHLAFMCAKWFRPGDVISFTRTPSVSELQRHGPKSEEGR